MRASIGTDWAWARRQSEIAAVGCPRFPFLAGPLLRSEVPAIAPVGGRLAGPALERDDLRVGELQPGHSLLAFVVVKELYVGHCKLVAAEGEDNGSLAVGSPLLGTIHCQQGANHPADVPILAALTMRISWENETASVRKLDSNDRWSRNRGGQHYLPAKIRSMAKISNPLERISVRLVR